MSDKKPFSKFKARSTDFQSDMNAVDAVLEHNRALFKQMTTSEFDRALDAMNDAMGDVQKQAVEAIRAAMQEQADETRKEIGELQQQITQIQQILATPALPREALDTPDERNEKSNYRSPRTPNSPSMVSSQSQTDEPKPKTWVDRTRALKKRPAAGTLVGLAAACLALLLFRRRR